MKAQDLEKIIKDLYHTRFKSLEKRVTSAINSAKDEKNINIENLNLAEIKTLSSTILDFETKKLHDELETLMAKKEQIQRDLEKNLCNFKK